MFLDSDFRYLPQNHWANYNKLMALSHELQGKKKNIKIKFFFKGKSLPKIENTLSSLKQFLQIYGLIANKHDLNHFGWKGV